MVPVYNMSLKHLMSPIILQAAENYESILNVFQRFVDLGADPRHNNDDLMKNISTLLGARVLHHFGCPIELAPHDIQNQFNAM